MVVETGSPGSVCTKAFKISMSFLHARSASWHHMPLRICRGGADVTRVLPRSAFYGNPALLRDIPGQHKATQTTGGLRLCFLPGACSSLGHAGSDVDTLGTRNFTCFCLLNGTEDWLKVTRSCGADAARRVLEPRPGHHKFHGPATF
jgi:hypothetical protein